MTQRVRFGSFEFDKGSRELFRESVPVRLQAQPAQVLARLLDRAGQLVTREELRDLVWGSATFVDFDRSLNFCISQIRSALRDESSNPRFIRTLPKQGYQFICAVEPTQESIPPVDISKAQAGGLLKWKYLVAGFLLAALCIGAIAVGWLKRDAPKVAVVQFDNETGDGSFDRLAEALTENVVVDLSSTSVDRYRIIGNAAILRMPKEQRNLNQIGSSLGVSYVILGQVQRQGDKVRILAHLIRLPDQTHLWVVRLDRDLTDELRFTSEAAQEISSQFSPRLQSKDR